MKKPHLISRIKNELGKIKYRYFLSVVVVFLIFIFSVILMSKNINFSSYIDVPSLSFVGMFPLIMMFILYGPAKIKKYFSEPLAEDSSEKILNETLSFFTIFNKIIWLSTLLVIIINAIEIMTNIKNQSELLMDLNFMIVLTLISPFYAVMINLTIICPYYIIIKEKLRKYENNQ